MPAYSGSMADRSAITQAVESDLAPYGVRVVVERPEPALPYTLISVGGTSDDLGVDRTPAITVFSDCGARNQRHLGWVFESGDTTVEANLASSLVGLVAGLDVTSNPESVMSSTASTNDVSFTNECEELSTTPIPCTEQHEQFCGPGEQNADAELASVFGDATPDVLPPSVEILQPPDGARFELGQDVVLTALVTDDFGGFGWKTTVNKDGEVLFDEVDYAKMNLDDQGRVVFSLQNAEAGEYTLTVTALDHADHSTQDTVSITIDSQPGTSTSGSETSEGSSTTGPDATDSDDTTGLPAADEGSTDGCGCRAANRRGYAAWLLSLLLVRRRYGYSS